MSACLCPGREQRLQPIQCSVINARKSRATDRTPIDCCSLKSSIVIPIVLLLWLCDHVTGTKLPVEFLHHHPHHLGNDPAFRVFYATGQGEMDLPICSPNSVCNKVDMYDSPWIERQCRCPAEQSCSMSLDINDGHTVTDKTRQFKTCEPVKKLPKCRFFRDVTWTFVNYPDNTTQQIMHCICPKNSVAYIIKRQAYQSEQGLGYHYSFACSPQSKLKCQRKEPCRLFTVKKRFEVDEVNTNTLCQCPHGHKCPKKHTDVGVIPGKIYTEDLIRTYSAYCM